MIPFDCTIFQNKLHDYEDFVIWFFLWYSQLLSPETNCFAFLLLFDIDLLFPRSGRSSVFESPEREHFPLLEVTAETGLWYWLLRGWGWGRVRKCNSAKRFWDWGELKSKINNRTRNLQTSWEPLTENVCHAWWILLTLVTTIHRDGRGRGLSESVKKRCCMTWNTLPLKLWKMISAACK